MLSPEQMQLLTRACQEGREVDKVLASARQAKIAKHLGTNRKAVNGLGRPRLEVDHASYHFWGQKLGYGCWKDKQFLNEFERDNPAARVKSAGTKLQVGFGDCQTPKRFSKKYSL